MSLLDFDLTSEIVKADTVGQAIGQHPKINWFDFSATLEDIKEHFWSKDIVVEVIEIESS